MQFALSDSEALEVLRNAQRDPNGLLIIDIPASRLLEALADRVNLTLDDLKRTVSHGRQAVSLSPKEYGVFRLVWQRGEVSHTDLEEEVWSKRGASIGAISGAVSGANAKLLDAGIPVELLNRDSRVSARKTG